MIRPSITVFALTITGALWAAFVTWALNLAVTFTSDRYPGQVYWANAVHNLIWWISTLIVVVFLVQVGGNRDARKIAFGLFVFAVADWWSAWALVFSLGRHLDSPTPPRAYISTVISFLLWTMAVWKYLKEHEHEPFPQEDSTLLPDTVGGPAYTGLPVAGGSIVWTNTL